MKKLWVILMCLIMLFNIAGCGGQAESSDTEPSAYIPTEVDSSAVKTVTGRVSGIEDTVVMLSQGGFPSGAQAVPGGRAPEMGRNDIPSMANSENNFGSFDFGDPPAMPEGQAGQPPEMQEGGFGNPFDTLDAPNEGSAPPNVPAEQEPPEGKFEPQGGQGGMNGIIPGADSAAFADEGELLRFDLTNAKVFLETAVGTTKGSLADISVGDMLSVEIDEAGTVFTATVMQMPDPISGGNGFASFGGSGNVEQGTAANTIDKDGTYTGTAYGSTGDDENALRIDGVAVTLDGITVNKSAGTSSNAETGDFYGMNAAVLATNGADVTITGAEISSSAKNGNGVFSYGQGTTVSISDSVITTASDNSGGIQTTGGGTTNASNLTVTTSGSSSAAIRSDRGGGTVRVDRGSYTTNGYNSPAVYSTADITVKNAQLTANNSEALVIEGKNSIVLENCEVSGNMSDTYGTSSDINVHSVMIYQSMSGDADVGTSAFSMTGGSLSSHNGDVFYVTNTSCVISLSGVELINKETDAYFLLASGNDASRGWGIAGANGAQAEFTADRQIFSGDIAVDAISALTMKITNESVFTGTVNIIPNAQGGTAVENNISVTMDSGCVWELTGDCSLTSLTNNGTIHFNGYTITLADGTVLSA